MSIFRDPALVWLLGGVLALLVLSTVTGAVLARAARGETARATIDNLNARTRAWWIMCLVFALALFTGGTGSIVLFCALSFLAMREYMTIAPTAPGDHHTLFWSFFLLTPLQYALIHPRIHWYGLFSILIPVYGFIFVATRSAMSGETQRFMERTGTIYWGLMACVYCVSYAPALLMLDIPGYRNNAKLLFFLVLVVQLSDVFQYVWGKTLGRHPIAPHVSPNKTWEGFVGGVLTATLVGGAIWWATPFSPLGAAGMALAIALMGFAGGLIMSAVKRDRGIKDYGTLIEGHGGVLDRLDSLAFAAPVFFHLTRYFLVA